MSTGNFRGGDCLLKGTGRCPAIRKGKVAQHEIRLGVNACSPGCREHIQVVVGNIPKLADKVKGLAQRTEMLLDGRQPKTTKAVASLKEEFEGLQPVVQNAVETHERLAKAARDAELEDVGTGLAQADAVARQMQVLTHAINECKRVPACPGNVVASLVAARDAIIAHQPMPEHLATLPRGGPRVVYEEAVKNAFCSAPGAQGVAQDAAAAAAAAAAGGSRMFLAAFSGSPLALLPAPEAQEEKAASGGYAGSQPLLALLPAEAPGSQAQEEYDNSSDKAPSQPPASQERALPIADKGANLATLEHAHKACEADPACPREVGKSLWQAMHVLKHGRFVDSDRAMLPRGGPSAVYSQDVIEAFLSAPGAEGVEPQQLDTAHAAPDQAAKAKRKACEAPVTTRPAKQAARGRGGA